MLIYTNNVVCVLLFFLGINYFKMLNTQHNRHVHNTEYIQSIFIHLNLKAFQLPHSCSSTDKVAVSLCTHCFTQ